MGTPLYPATVNPVRGLLAKPVFFQRRLYRFAQKYRDLRSQLLHEIDSSDLMSVHRHTSRSDTVVWPTFGYR